jgi:hypothetical protein
LCSISDLLSRVELKGAVILANAPVYVSLPTTDLLRARRFYETSLGLPVAAVGGPEPGNPDLCAAG